MFDYVSILFILQESFDSIQRWIKEAKEFAGDETKIVLVGNKSDLRDEKSVEYDKAKVF